MATTEAAARLRRSKTYLPDQEREELLKFAQVLNGINIAVGDPGRAMLVGPDGKQVPIPAELFRVLEEAANVLALGDGISILPYSAKLTTQEAADFLGMSRPTFVKILQSGAIPFEMAGRHRRVTLRDVVDYQARAQRERRAALSELAKDSIEHYDKLPKGVPSLKRRSQSEG
ncbi:excisionase family DNA-binding protein [Calidifontibacter sp. DB0510]|uniref:Excisionase family DNA-binding protein n=1 Tax=Metallococcus carri TaxID=1656884 RepID=A0A967EHF6_9MICO|nr:excisionase family DNA-binding protein [Metallococcus carri]NHN56283.1 excisionase family DNA-binding protein [Metallococcus carri]NOP38665.1 excisionase family DNA-binding protein [Calidifontibacter sp. DB2511S]